MKNGIVVSLLLMFQMMGQTQESIAFYCDVMVNAYEGKHREAAADKFKKLLTEELAKPGSFQNKLEELKWLSVKYDAGGSFRIITWQVKNAKNLHLYNGIIQKNDDTTIPLIDASNPSKDVEYEMNDATSWIGALYYNLKEVEKDGKKYYLLFGYDGTDGITNFKVCDVLTFGKDGKPIFGEEIFLIKDGQRPDLKTRIVLQYSSIANVNFNFNEGMDMIVHDFIIARAGISPDEAVSRIPDGSYAGYKWDGKYWNFIEKIEHQITAENEVYFQPKPKETEKKDIFGRRKD